MKKNITPVLVNFWSSMYCHKRTSNSIAISDSEDGDEDSLIWLKLSVIESEAPHPGDMFFELVVQKHVAIHFSWGFEKL